MNKEYEMGDVVALQDIWTPHAQSFLGMVRSNDGLQAHYVASDPKASYTLINPKADLAQYNDVFGCSRSVSDST